MATCRRGRLFVTVDLHGVAFFRAPTLRKARKDHVCGECGLPILAGQNYVDSRVRMGLNMPWTERRCCSCGVLSEKEESRWDADDRHEEIMDATWGIQD